MQKFNKKSLICSDDDAFVAYLYGEMPTPEREAFEDHLIVCVPCTDEFAAAADSRYSVFEWKKLDFDPLETPVFEIPYAEAKPSYSWVDSLKGIFATGPRLATAGAFGLVLAILGFAFYGGSFSGEEIAEVPPIPETRSIERPATAPANADPVIGSDDSNTPEIEPALVVVKDKEPQKARRSVKTIAPKSTVAQRTAERVRVPRLNDFDEFSDESLRLADLVSDIGSLDD